MVMLRQWSRYAKQFPLIYIQDHVRKGMRQTLSTSVPCLARGSRRKVSDSIAVDQQDKNDKTVKPNATEYDFVEEAFSSESTKELLENAASYEDSPLSPDDVWTQGPYPHNSNYKQSQAKHSNRPKVDPQETSIVLFPGQGTQYVGMGKELLKYPNVQEMYECASEILGFDLLDLSLNGPPQKLNKTVHQQPAVVVASLAAIEKLRDERPSVLDCCVGVAGFSVGEITALIFAGALSFEDAIRLVKVRAQSMQLASEITPSGMMTVMYGPDSRLNFACSVAKEFCKRQELPEVDCRIANYLFPHCKVIAGNDEALKFIEENKSDFRLRRLKRLPVSGAFHTDLMKPAAEPVKEMLAKLKIEKPIIPVHSNIDGKYYKSVNQISKQLPKQIYSPVKWEQTMHVLYERSQGTHFPKTFECGPGRSLKAILKLCNAKAWDSCISIEA
ncbi:probable malonyl-CoA-acyl carrier protein transacylase, mitochondrial [Procambarus clarkii]|uniref:probable malonyl-CoA-acyl carrier protein transacylase, mitochondrial n=1 Tax=Procambarus clarkii TaxID=6728 RepID=UPI001E677BBD|nr:probable malonyl-CoA-acyl carrier protein transacylase, mitochondrial [Procambarus clarkii]XP_045615244.1 probable malonyl-CoA-acyl carrier protein transacylase, mitochondrial [Procambarus clarkii]XP_045615245.1 probable malonyl-CoA-acyl carrier protein transacylase, mitochondrial [Procambarus clarkii]XP_045615246.1 probable malonyl-CoA-acyl carrier protein transacylase, mitochondrial [Procambarus clarkii]XP_045615247.1 probable malonyl-CoA-acyl carrier protein transacylase, mitochondrial [P